uniref:Mitogen-activated protein kinase 15 n=1 Tax=Esox lucius TaxID=8010 RepID=A0A6Q2YT07_ESOLU
GRGSYYTGAYGIVWKAVEKQTGEVVAVKKIFDAFRNRTDAQRTFREIMFLQEFGDHDNIVKLLNVIRAQNDKDIYLVFEYMDTDLHAVIKKGNLLKEIHKRYVMYQLLKATKYLHSGNVIHRDQKPSNILLDTDCFVKLCDFGLARSLYQIQEDSGNPALTEYVATRWYRAPEILLGSSRYTKGVDMWSIGCILGEMLLGKPLFPGTSTINQIERIMSAIPHPSPEDILSIKSEYGASVIQRMLLRPSVSLEELLQPSVPSDALDLVCRLLVFNPDKRLTAEQALQHPYVSKFHNPAKEPALDYDVILPVDDDVQLSVVQYRNKLYEVMGGEKGPQGECHGMSSQSPGRKMSLRWGVKAVTMEGNGPMRRTKNVQNQSPWLMTVEGTVGLKIFIVRQSTRLFIRLSAYKPQHLCPPSRLWRKLAPQLTPSWERPHIIPSHMLPVSRFTLKETCGPPHSHRPSTVHTHIFYFFLSNFMVSNT